MYFPLRGKCSLDRAQDCRTCAPRAARCHSWAQHPGVGHCGAANRAQMRVEIAHHPHCCAPRQGLHMFFFLHQSLKLCEEGLFVFIARCFLRGISSDEGVILWALSFTIHISNTANPASTTLHWIIALGELLLVKSPHLKQKQNATMCITPGFTPREAEVDWPAVSAVNCPF
ncbi:unnamed protein product [Symbiodinium natans]|uniref:Uncharacterized protein n=1 Tax=Symbiodinium natans TaxID=878477 RepID=A0A812USI8_9DINO|nr:unnamed protein product [Symbiodinium natans]